MSDPKLAGASVPTPARQHVRDALAICFGDARYDQQTWRIVAAAFDAAWPEHTESSGVPTPAPPAPLEYSALRHDLRLARGMCQRLVEALERRLGEFDVMPDVIHEARALLAAAVPHPQTTKTKDEEKNDDVSRVERQ